MNTKVAYIIDTISCNTAGTQKQLLEMIKRLDKSSFSIQLICLWESEWMTCNTLPCPCIVLGYKGFLKANFPHVIWRLYHIIKDNKIQIIQTYYEDSIFVTLLSAIFISPRPVLISSRRDIGLGDNNQPWYHHLFKVVLPHVNKFFNGILANSEQVRQYVAAQEKTPLEKIKVIKNGVSLLTDYFYMPDIFKNNQNVIWLGMAASLTPVKRHDLLLKALVILKKKYPTCSIKVLLLGDGPERESLIRTCMELNLNDIVYLIGEVTCPVTYLYYVDVCVLCSDREGLSNAILEYMTCGKPVVATAVGGNVELIDRQNGILVAPDEPEFLAEALGELIIDEKMRKKMGEASLKKVQEQYSWQIAMSELENYYRELVGGK
jgi:glycosyltransferase involved in cell wall biosynthesis